MHAVVQYWKTGGRLGMLLHMAVGLVAMAGWPKACPDSGSGRNIHVLRMWDDITARRAGCASLHNCPAAESNLIYA